MAEGLGPDSVVTEGLGPDSILIPAESPCILQAIIWELQYSRKL